MSVSGTPASNQVVNANTSSENPPRPSVAQNPSYEKLRRFLQAYWLRPENALWMTLRSDTLSQCPFVRPAVDLACGDGIFSFFHHGGVLDPVFDVFMAVGSLDRVKDEHADMFDCASDTYRPALLQPAVNAIDVGVDHKQALLNKAAVLNLYEKLIEHDCNEPLPFENDSFGTIYCNAAYWIDRVDSLLGELARMVQPGGRVILQVKLESMKHYTLDAYRSELGDKFLDIIGRGRHETWPTLADRVTWEKRFDHAGLRIESATPFITQAHAQLWDVGLRPLAPILIKMANGLTAKTRASIKKEWVDLFMDLLTPLCRPDLQLGFSQDEPAEIQYVLSSGK